MKSDWQRLTIVIHSLTGGGSEHAAANMASYWAETGREVTLLTLDSVENDQIELFPKVERVALGVMSDSRGIWSAIRANCHRIRKLRAALMKSAPDRVISLTDRMNVLTLLAARKTKLRVFVAERTDIRHHRTGRVWEWLRKRTYPTACSIIVQTEAVKAAVQQFAGRAPVHVIPNAVSIPDTGGREQEIRLLDGRRWFVAVGRLSHEKGFDRLIDAFASTAEKCPEWNLLIVGDGPEKSRLVKSVRNYDLDHRIRLAGWVESPWSALPTSSISVLPSRYEGFPNVLLEAMSHGIAPIAFDCQSGPSEIIRHNLDGLLVPADDVSGLSAAMLSLANDPELRSRLADAARSVTDRFSPDRVFGQWGAILEHPAGTLRPL